MLLLLVKRISNYLCLQWGTASSGTSVNFPITFTKVYACVGHIAYNSTSGASYNRFPYDITNSGFAHKETSGDSSILQWIAIGKKT